MDIFDRLVKHFGTQDRVAEALAVSQATVSGWVRGEHGMSAITAMRAEQITSGAFPAVELCPALKRLSAVA
jgi:DNA-binding transcriptional regulator YdaS (Cro superfamily)